MKGNCFEMVTAQELKIAGGDVLLGPDNQQVTVVKAVKHGKATRQFVSITTPYHTRPFEITADHRLVVEGSGGCLEQMVASDFASMAQEIRPRLLCGAGLSMATVKVVEEKECEVVAITFAQDETVMAWLLAEKRPPKGHGPSFSGDRAVVCYGENLLRRDLIRSLFFEGKFRNPALVEKNTFLDVDKRNTLLYSVSPSMPRRSLSEGRLFPHI